MPEIIAKRKREDTLLKDEPAMVSSDNPFPRGGGSSLAPSEIRKATTEATSDVFEQMIKQRKNKKAKHKATISLSSQVKTEPFTLSKIKVGTLVLGQVVEIKFAIKELVVSLPNNLIGYCPTEVVSPALLNRVLRFTVTDLSDSSKRRSILSTDPELVNSSIDSSEVVNGLALQGNVMSVQEKGVILDLGETLGQGFVAGKSDKHSVGEPLLAFVANADRRIKTLTLNPKASVSTVMSQASLAPGTLVTSAPVESVTPMGRIFDLLGYIKATSDVIHSRGSEKAVRILFSYPPLQINGDRQLGVTSLPHLVELDSSLVENIPKIGSIVDGTVSQVKQNLGLFSTSSDHRNTIGFAHISQIKSINGEKQVDLEISEFAEGTEHRARVISAPAVDGIPYLSLDPEISEQKYMSILDVSIGDVVRNAAVDRILPKGGVLVKLSQSIVGIANELQLSDTAMKNPELKYKVGQRVVARVLNVDLERERIELSLKKSIVEFSGELLMSYDRIGGTTIGTVIKLMDQGAKLGFFGGIKGLLPTSQSSESGAKPSQILRVGQSVRVHVIEADASRDRLIVSNRPISQLHDYIGQIIDGRVSSKNKHEASVVLGQEGELGEATLIGSPKQIKVDDKLQVKVLTDRSVTNEATLIEEHLPANIDELEIGQQSFGFVSGKQENIGLFVGFAAGLVGLVPANVIGHNSWPSIGAVIKVVVDAIDRQQNRVSLSFPTAPRTVSATVTAVKDTQLNVVTSDGQQGRIDVSQVFKSIEEVTDEKKPSSVFHAGQKLDNLSVIGRHDARNHRFSPLSHRTGTNVVLELAINATPALKAGDKALAFVNNYSDDMQSVWVTLTPTSRGQMSLVDSTSDAEKLAEPFKYYPVGSALTVTVSKSGPKPSLTALNGEQSNRALVFAVDVLRIMVRLPYHKTAAISCVDTGVKFTKLKSTFHAGNIVEFNKNNGRITLRSHAHEPVAENQVRYGFVCNIADGGVFVMLAPNVIGRVQIGQLSDTYLKNWKSFLKIGDVVQAKVISIKPGKPSKIELSLKPSVITGRKQPNIDKISVGKNYSGKIKRIESFGVFIDFHDVTGLAHKSEISDRPIDDLSRVFKVGDSVRVKVSDKDIDAGKLSLGLKASYFENDDDRDDSGDDSASEDVEMDSDSSEDESSTDIHKFVESDSNDSAIWKGSSEVSDSESEISDDLEDENNSKKSLSAGFDWFGETLDSKFSEKPQESGDDSDSDDEPRQRRRRKREEFVKDETANLQTRLPQSAKDFERLLVSSPESSILWMNYMAFELQLGEIDNARQIARRALKMIPQKDEEERLNIWVALSNLEVQFGTDYSATETFKEAQKHMDSLTIHLRMATVYAQSGQIQKAREIYKRTHKRFGGESMEPWLSEMRFLFGDGMDKVAARALAESASQRLPTRMHRDFTKQFALLEFEKGDPERGRTLFEALLDAAPKRIDIWNVYIDQEIKHGDESKFQPSFDRVLTQRISLKQAKFFFKKWIEVASDQDYVKSRAKEYVEERQQASNDNDD